MRTRIGLVFLLPACAFPQNQNAIGITSTNNTAGQLGGTMTIGAAHRVTVPQPQLRAPNGNGSGAKREPWAVSLSRPTGTSYSGAASGSCSGHGRSGWFSVPPMVKALSSPVKSSELKSSKAF